MTLSAWLAASLSSAIAAPNQTEILDAFLSSLACRNAIISGGQNLAGAINFWTPSNNHPFGVFTVVPVRTGEPGQSRVNIFYPFNGQYLADQNNGMHSSVTKLSWSRNDDLVVWDYKRLWWLDGRSVKAGGRVGFEQVDVPRSIYPVMRGGDEGVPEHFADVAMSAGANYRDILQFDPRTGSFSDAGIEVGTSGGLAWTSDRRFVRVQRNGETRQKHLEILEPDLKTWTRFSPAALPADARLLVLRHHSVSSELEAIAVWRDRDGIGQIGVIRRGAAAPRIIADGPIERAVATPDRSGLYGYIDQKGRFHRVPGEAHAPNVLFWLTKLEAMNGVENFYLLGDAKYAVVKANDGTAGPKVTIFERHGEQERAIGSLCETRSPIERILKTDKAILFLPTNPRGNSLVVYLHGGPRYHVGETGDLYVDLVAALGHPVLAVNYTGSIDQRHQHEPAQTLAESYGREVEQGLEYARALSGMSARKVVILANSFGSIVAFSALLSGRVAPDGLLVVSGVTDPKSVLEINGPDLDSAYLGYLRRAASEVRPFDIEELIKLNPGLRLAFLHGGLDRAVAVSEVEAFVRRFNAAKPRVPARLTVDGEMGHTPSTRAQYQRHNEAISAFLTE